VITPQAMKRAIIITSVLTLLSAMLLIYAFRDTNLWFSLFYLVLGILAIISAIRYTVGIPLMVTRVLVMYLCLYSSVGKRCEFFILKQLDFELVLLNSHWIVERRCFKFNNMRDEASDRKSNKNTIVVKIGGLKLKYTITFLL
jgi:1,4-dihydroxy-2-naphthoate octaprenyltransferase